MNMDKETEEMETNFDLAMATIRDELDLAAGRIESKFKADLQKPMFLKHLRILVETVNDVVDTLDDMARDVEKKQKEERQELY